MIASISNSKALLRQAQRALSYKLPPPTWSLKDLNLTSDGPPLSEEELHVLAKRALIDVSNMKDTESLRRDLANMLHCLKQVHSVEVEDEALSDEDIYDAPRNLTGAPVAATRTEWEEEARSVWQHMLQPKTTRQGSHEYFAIVEQKEKDEE
jgi:hypothetical protein